MRTLMTAELMETLVDHSAGNYRVLMIMGGELLAHGMAHEVAQLDEKCYLEVYQPRNTRPAPKKKVRVVTMAMTGEQVLPVVRVAEICQRTRCRAVAGRRALECQLGGRDRRCSQVRQDVAGAGHGPLRVATGTSCLGKYAVPEPGPVSDLPGRGCAAGCARACRGNGPASSVSISDQVEIHVITAPVLRLDRDRDRARLWETTRQLRPKLLLLDPLVRLHGIDENHAGEVAELLAYFRSLATAASISRFCWCITRGRTPRRCCGQVRACAARATSTPSATRTSISGEVAEHLVLSSEHRAAPAAASVYLELVATDAARAHLEVIAEPDDESGRSLEEQVLNLLAQGEMLTRTRLRNALAVNNERLGKALESLERAGRVTRTPRGWQGLR